MEQISKKAKVVGTKQVLRALAEGRVSLVYLAADADEPLRQRVREAWRSRRSGGAGGAFHVGAG